MDYLFLPLDEQTPYLDETDKRRLYEAFEFAKQAHHGQHRQSGEQYITHPVAVACLLTQLRIDVETLIAALLHDVIEDTRYSSEYISDHYGHQVGFLVSGVSRLDNLPLKRVDEQQALQFGRLLLAMAEDLRVILIKLADRMHNIQSLKVFSSKKALRIAKETLEIYVPLAAKIGMNPWRIFLENQCFNIMYPRRYLAILKAMRTAKGDRIELLNSTIDSVEQAMARANITVHAIKGREKRPYSLFRKMKSHNLRFRQLLDIFAFRVVVDSVDECYRALGALHQLFKPVHGQFKDYIAIPKLNGYQSLHTVLINAGGIQAEFQIRTQSMDINAEFGIAAHWKYKALEDNPDKPQKEWSSKLLHNLVEMYSETSNKTDFFEQVKEELMPEDLIVFSPKGELINLPRGSTALDFAYAIHTEIGKTAHYASINRVACALDTELQNGHLVEVHTSFNASPNPEQLEFVKTIRARAGIRAHLRQLQQDDLALRGKSLLHSTLKNYCLNIHSQAEDTLNKLAQSLKLNGEKDLYISIGKGERPASLVYSQLLLMLGEEGGQSLPQPAIVKVPLITIDEQSHHKMQFGRCCRPICQDAVIGYLSGDRGLVVHRRKCRNTRDSAANPSQWVNLTWQLEQLELLASFRVESNNVVNILAIIAAKISENNTEIEDVQVKRLTNKVQMDFVIKILNRHALAQMVKDLRKYPDVLRVYRF